MHSGNWYAFTVGSIRVISLNNDDVCLQDGAFSAFRVPAFRASACGYFGHMWELYAFWTLVPLLLLPVLAGPQAQAVASADVSGWAFAVIAIGRLRESAGPIAKQVKGELPIDKNINDSMVRTVRELSRKGWSSNEIAKKLLIDENSIRFIINTASM